MNSSKYLVRVGGDLFVVEAKDNQEARYKGAKLFKEKHLLTESLSDITPYASTKLVLEPIEATKEVISKLRPTPTSSNPPITNNLNYCPLCGNYTGYLEWHHWWENSEFRQSRTCPSCNSQLGKLFEGNYPKWEDQVNRMRQYFEETNSEDSKIGEVSYPSYPKQGLPPVTKRRRYSQRSRNYSVTIKDKIYQVVGYNNRKAKYEAVKLYKKELRLTEPIEAYLNLCKVEVGCELLNTYDYR